MFRKLEPPIKIPNENITKINIGGLKGRIAHFDAKDNRQKRDIVIIAGHHTSHERMLGFADFLVEFGNVYMIDLPGFGGMNSFPTIGKQISHESYAEYIYTVLKTQKLTKEIMIFSVSLGGQFVTRMFQMYPQSQAWVKDFVGFATFASASNFNMKGPYKYVARIYVAIVATRPGAFMLNLIFMNRYFLWSVMFVLSKFKKKMQTGDAQQRHEYIQMESYLWQSNDKLTHARTAKLMFKSDLRLKSDNMIDVRFTNVLTHNDQYVDAKEVNKSFRDIFMNYRPHYLDLSVHMPSTISRNEVAQMLDDALINDIMYQKDK